MEKIDYRFGMEIVDLNKLEHFLIYIESKQDVDKIINCCCQKKRLKITVWEIMEGTETVVERREFI